MMVKEFGKRNGEAVMLLHGGGLSWWSYREAAKLLEEDYHVILPVLDGHGGSGEAFTTIEANAARLIGYIDAHLGGHVAVLGGLSLGGQIVLEMLAQRPDICRYALVESALAKPMKLTGALIAPAFSMSYGLVQKRWFAKLQAAYLGIPKELFEDYYRDTCAVSRADMVAFTKANCAYDPGDKLGKITAGVTVVAGAREQKSILRSAQCLHRAIPGSRMEILPGLRHGELSICHPVRYSKMIRDIME